MTARQLVAIAKSKNLLLSTAESCTGGLIAGAITDIAGSSAVFDRGFVTYSNAAKTEMLGVSPDLIAFYGAVSEEVALAMAQGALSHSQAQIAVSVTGIAGPGGSDHKPEGMVCFGWGSAGTVKTETRQFGPLGRSEVRKATVAHAIRLLTDVATHCTESSV